MKRFCFLEEKINNSATSLALMPMDANFIFIEKSLNFLGKQTKNDLKQTMTVPFYMDSSCCKS